MIKAYHIYYLHKDGGKRKRLAIVENDSELYAVIDEIQNDGGVIRRVVDVTIK